MRDLRHFKALVLGISPQHFTGHSNFAVCTPPHPPAYTKYKGDDHEPRVDLSREFVELTSRIVDFNNESATNNPNLRFAPQFHRFGCHVRKYTDRNPSMSRWTTAMRSGERGKSVTCSTSTNAGGWPWGRVSSPTSRSCTPSSKLILKYKKHEVQSAHYVNSIIFLFLYFYRSFFLHI